MLGGLALILGGVALASGACACLARGAPVRRGRERLDPPRRRADDLDFLAELYADEDVRPFLAAAGSLRPRRASSPIERVARDPDAGG